MKTMTKAISRRIVPVVVLSVLCCLVEQGCSGPPSQQPSQQTYDLVIAGGRVIDPETNLDAVRNIGITNGTIAVVTEQNLSGKQTIDAKGLVVAPGFIDPHSHGVELPAYRMQAYDGVTTALELESGLLPIARWYEMSAKEGRPINYGASASFTFSRIAAMVPEMPPVEPTAGWYQSAFKYSNWTTDVSTGEQLDRIIGGLEQGLKDGALGIGVNAGYVPGVGGKELGKVWELGARYKVPVMTHMRNWSLIDPLSSVEGLEQVIGLAASSGARTHIFHIHSTMLLDTPVALHMLEQARAAGLKITTEAYPYGIGTIPLGSAIFRRSQEDLRKTMGIEFTDVRLTAKGRMITGEADIRKEQKSDPGQFTVFKFLDEDKPVPAAILDQVITTPWMMIGSDTVPWDYSNGTPVQGNAWPMTKDMLSHPRSAGNYSKLLREYVRERKLLTWLDAFRKGSLFPAQMLEESVPMMKKKGRIQVGMDADITVFDPETITDRSSVEFPAQTSEGVKYLVVNGHIVINDGKMDLAAFPGRPIKR